MSDTADGHNTNPPAGARPNETRVKRTLQGQIGTIMLVVILIFGTNFFFIKIHLDKIQDDAYMTDALGRQRMLVMQMAYDANRLQRDEENTRIELRRAMEEYQTAHEVFIFGGRLSGITGQETVKPLPKSMRQLLTENENDWETYKPLIDTVIASPQSEEARTAVQEMAWVAPVLVERNDAIVKAYTAYSLRNEQMLIMWTIISLTCSTLVVIMFYQGVKRHLTTPIMKITDVARAAERGDYTVHADIMTGDEIEELARAANSAMDALAKTKREHDEIDKAKVTFLTMASHELRSPMTPIQAQLQMLIMGYFGRLNKKQLEAVEIAQRNAQHLDVVIQDMLELSRIEAAKIAFSFKKADLEKEIYLTVKGMENYCTTKNVRVRFKPSKIPSVHCDPDRVSQVLRNILTNAIKFSEDKSEVVVSVENAPQEVIVSVQDHGRGMSDDTKRKLFEPFYQEDNIYGRQYGGTGLGLSICKGIVEMMGGRIWFESEQGKGTTFRFSIPKTPPKTVERVNLLSTSDERWKTLLQGK
ncbi:TPA: HAMP domain-containing protein [Candidatus Woesearchaeota archaeon]|nr:HAMP domain-containing protein [Candidatus Woesearchaeota archaeon]